MFNLINKPLRLGIKRWYNKTKNQKIKNLQILLSRRISCQGYYNIKIGGNSFILFADKEDEVMPYLVWPWHNEEIETISIYSELCKQSSCILDIGAYNGLFSLIANSINKDAKIYSFEPNPYTFKILEKNIQLNGFKNIEISSFALGSQKEDSILYIPKDKPLSSDSSPVKGFRENTDANKISFETLDNLREKKILPKIDLIKMDVETFEHEVLNGSHYVLKKDLPIIISEVLYNRNEREIQSVLDKFNYTYYIMTSEGLVKKFLIRGDSKYINRNYLFCPNNKLSLISSFLYK